LPNLSLSRRTGEGQGKGWRITLHCLFTRHGDIPSHDTKIKPIPGRLPFGHAYLTARNAAKAIEFYKRAFGAQERGVLPMPVEKSATRTDDRKFHSDACRRIPEHGNQSPQALDGSPVGLAIYVENVDEVFNRAVQAGATVKEPVSDKFWATAPAPSPTLRPQMTILTHIEDVSLDEMKKRMEKMFANKDAREYRPHVSLEISSGVEKSASASALTALGKAPWSRSTLAPAPAPIRSSSPLDRPFCFRNSDLMRCISSWARRISFNPSSFTSSHQGEPRDIF